MGSADSMPAVVRAWHEVVDSHDPARLDDLLADHVVFLSPAVHAPQEGKPLTTAYLTAAMKVLGPTLEYVHEWWDGGSAVLEFTATVTGADERARNVHGIDMLRWNTANKLTSFTVMVRPLRGLETLVELMGAELAG